MIVDAGGGTVDLSTYLFTSTVPTTVEEIAPPDCNILHYCVALIVYALINYPGTLQGSTRVNVRAERFLRGEYISLSPNLNCSD